VTKAPWFELVWSMDSTWLADCTISLVSSIAMPTVWKTLEVWEVLDVVAWLAADPDAADAAEAEAAAWDEVAAWDEAALESLAACCSGAWVHLGMTRKSRSKSTMTAAAMGRAIGGMEAGRSKDSGPISSLCGLPESINDFDSCASRRGGRVD
jgi:hypothetical protein